MEWWKSTESQSPMCVWYVMFKPFELGHLESGSDNKDFMIIDCDEARRWSENEDEDDDGEDDNDLNNGHQDADEDDDDKIQSEQFGCFTENT